jgi:sugar/nucleoside kinase (ribokinase family)
MKRGLLQMSGIVVDILQKVERLPRPGEGLAAQSGRVGPGGGFNALAAARRAGAEVAYGGALGAGPLASVVRGALEREGAPALQARVKEGDQGFCTVWVERGGERAYVYSPGAEWGATADDLAELPAGDFAWALIAGYASPEPAGPDMFGDWLAALPKGVRLMFDPTPLILSVGAERVARALNRADWVSANRAEAQALTGQAPALAARTLSKGREGAIVRDGARGCWLSQAGGAARLVEGFSVQAVDATGAGDAHVGAFIAARLAGRPAFEAARFANAAAALSVTRLGGATAPSLAETLALLEGRPVTSNG